MDFTAWLEQVDRRFRTKWGVGIADSGWDTFDWEDRWQGGWTPAQAFREVVDLLEVK